MTDSELVPWGKGEKQPGEGDEIVPETLYLPGTKAQEHLTKVSYSIERLKDWKNKRLND